MHNNNKMKVSELKEIIRKTIADVVSEATTTTTIDYKDKNRGDKILDIDLADTATVNKLKSDSAVASVTAGNKKIKEVEIDEMANVSVRYQLAGDANADDFKGKKNRIITAMKATGEPMAKIDVAGELGYDKQNPINSDFMELVASGIIEPAGEQKAPRLTRPASDKPKGGEDEDGFVTGDMSDEEVDAMFAKAKASGDEEPEIGDIEKADVSAAKMSDEDYEAFMKVSDLENRLAATKSNILKLKKSKIAAGDISDKPSDELLRLRDLKTSLEKRIDDTVGSSKYLQQRQEKATGKKYEPINIEDVETEPLDEWTINRMQFYAGIKK
jgi:hypothetical protein